MVHQGWLTKMTKEFMILFLFKKTHKNIVPTTLEKFSAGWLRILPVLGT
jgi:hypothetical protein